MSEKRLYPLVIGSLDEGFPDYVVMNGWLSFNNLSEVMDTYLDRVVGEAVFDRYGTQFPIFVRELSAPVEPQVCPDDELAYQRYDALGKAKFWYVKRAGEGAAVMLGFKEQCDAATLLDKSASNTLGGLMNTIHPKAGDSFFIHPGEIHAAVGDMDIVEVSESSVLDFRMGDPNDIIEALDFINYSAYKPSDESTAEFCVKKRDIDEPVKIVSEDDDSFTMLHCLNGSIDIVYDDDVLGKICFSLNAGFTALIPSEAESSCMLVPKKQPASVLELYCDLKPLRDKYIDPNAEASLPNENGGDE